jgi:hypothetical protein
MLENFYEKSVNSSHIVLSDANFERKCGDNNIRFSDIIFMEILNVWHQNINKPVLQILMFSNKIRMAIFYIKCFIWPHTQNEL